MKVLTDLDLEKIYYGWLGKAIGVRYGAPVEMWSSEQIQEKYGQKDGYFEEYHDFAADDDTNGPIFFYRALRDCKDIEQYGFDDLTNCWMNYVPYEHGFYWWGGYGVSEEHTAYLNLLNGIKPPLSGSILQNGKVMAEQIGGQIFSDVWGLVVPHDLSLAASLAEKASQVSHDGVAVDGGIFIASMISAAFSASSIHDMIYKALDQIDANREYAIMVRDLIRFHDESHPQEECFSYIKKNYWKDKYGGNCHIIPNAAIMIYALLYGEGDFIKTLKIANYSGFDTDCNVGNLGTIMGVFTQLKNVDYAKWIAPIQDTTLCSSVLGYSNIVNIPLFAYDLFKTALRLQKQSYVGKYQFSLQHDLDDVHLDFMLPYSTGGIRSENTTFENQDHHLSIHVLPHIQHKIYIKTYYGKDDLADNRYDPCFSPKVYHGQTIYVDYEENEDVDVYLFYEDIHNHQIYQSKANEHAFSIEGCKDALIGKIGLILQAKKETTFHLISLDCKGKIDYILDFSKEKMENYSLEHNEVSQCTYYNGIWQLENGHLTGRCLQNGQLFTAKPIADFTLKTTFTAHIAKETGILFKVQGVRRQYRLSFENDKAILYRIFEEKSKLIEEEFKLIENQAYALKIEMIQNHIKIFIDDSLIIDHIDPSPIKKGCIGVYVSNGSVLSIKKIEVKEI